MSSWAAVGLPLAVLRGSINGTLAWYRVVHRGYYKDVFGVKVGDAVIPLDVSPFKKVLMRTAERYIDSFYLVECRGEEYTYEKYLGVCDFDVVSSDFDVLDDLVAIMNVVSSLISLRGLCGEMKEFMNYSRFYGVRVENDFRLRVGSTVSIDVQRVFGGSLVSVVIDYPSLGAVYRSVWEVSRYDGDDVFVRPVVDLAKKIVERYNIEMFDLPVIRF